MNTITISFEGKNSEQATKVLTDWLSEIGQDVLMEILEKNDVDVLTTKLNPGEGSLIMNVGKFEDSKIISLAPQSEERSVLCGKNTA
jgi:hypothetical protein